MKTISRLYKSTLLLGLFGSTSLVSCVNVNKTVGIDGNDNQRTPFTFGNAVRSGWQNVYQGCRYVSQYAQRNPELAYTAGLSFLVGFQDSWRGKHSSSSKAIPSSDQRYNNKSAWHQP